MKFKLRMVLIGLALVVLIANDTHAQNFWTGAGSNNLWSNANNWSLGVVPLGAWQDPQFGWDDPAGPFYPLTPSTSDDGPVGNNNAMLRKPGVFDPIQVLIDPTVHAKAYGVRVGLDGAPATLEITGGILDIGGTPPTGGDRQGWHFDIGRAFNRSGDPNTKQRVIMSGGTVNTNGLLIPEQFVDDSLADPTDSAPLNGELYMSGGVINARWMNLGQLKGNGKAELSGNAIINLVPNIVSNPANGGHFSFNRNWFLNGQPVPSSGTVSLDIRDNAIINVFGNRNEFIEDPNASELAVYQSYIDSGELTADNGTDVPTLYMNESEGIIKVCALDADFDRDCDTDEDDLATWQANYDTNGTPGDLKAMGDADNDGDVDGADFLEWQREYGVGISNLPPPPFLVTVPEPTSLYLALVCTISFVARRQGSMGNVRISGDMIAKNLR
mgnify:CR=1 FL=1